MKPDSLKYLELIDSKKTALHEYLSDFTDEALHTIPAEGKWSAIMTIHHLILAEMGSLAYCKKKLSFNPELPVATPDEIAMETKVPYMLRSPKYKATAPPGIDTPNLDNTLSLDNIFGKWDAVRAEMKSFLETQPAEMYEKALYKHPLGGKMRLQGMVMFFDGHLDSHTDQIVGNFESMAE